ncbi:DUF1642 domain-containing protein [Bacillus sp. 03113]|uniref:DUF1642 domain-containing protein n=1 Tax=Bacillus sp. 03113 TaxID=2578211 RepID=UPI001141C763|nr:DUF1642 domain-containing protein [Bacillus sp. 03113]
MSEIKKVVLPKEVAEAVEGFRFHLGMDELDLINIEKFGERYKREYRQWYGAIIKYFEDSRLDYIRALVNGYEIAKSPEERLREYFNARSAEYHRELAVGWSVRAQYYKGQVIAIKEMLDILSIKLEGINA